MPYPIQKSVIEPDMKKPRHKKKNGNRSKRAKDRGLRFMQHPFAGADPEKLKAALVEIAKKKIGEFPEYITKIQDLLRKKDPLQILAGLSYGLMTTVSNKGISHKKMLSGIEQHHIELMQALILTIPRSEWGIYPAIPDDMQSAIDDINSLADAFHQRRFIAIEENKDEVERVSLALQERLRLHTQGVRNWGYFSDVIKISRKLYGALDDKLAAFHGFTANELITVGEYLASALEARQTARIAKLGKVFNTRNIPELVRRYYAAYPFMKDTAEEFIKIIPPGTSIEAVKSRLLAHADLSLPDYMKIDPKEVANQTGLPLESAIKILTKISLMPGALSSQDPEYFFMGNPMWQAPGIMLNNEFFFVVPQAMFSHIHRLMRALFQEANLRPQLETRRKDYLEEAMRERISAVMPQAQYTPNAKWAYGGKIYETDLLIQLDRLVIIMEAKSAAVTSEALRGAPMRAQRHIKELVVEPSEQSARLEKIIWDAKLGDAEAHKITEKLGIPATEIDNIIRLSITLDDFSVLCAAERELKMAGWVNPEIFLAPAMNIADFGCICHILNQPSFLIHYLTTRYRLQKTMDIMGDELDYLGLYLSTGFNFAKFEQSGEGLVISGKSSEIDHYFNSSDAGVPIKKPHPDIHPYLKSLIDELERKQAIGWTTLAIDILRCGSLDEQKQLVKGMDTLRKNIPKQCHDPKHICSVIMTPPAPNDTSIMFYVYPQKLAAKAKDLAGHIASEHMEKNGCKRCVIVGRKIEEWERPYQFVGLAVKHD